jgi:hypothetical protein
MKKQGKEKLKKLLHREADKILKGFVSRYDLDFPRRPKDKKKRKLPKPRKVA